MARIKIKQLGERVATMGLHMGGDRRRRKLEPGEVVDIPDDLMVDDELSLVDMLWQTDTVDLTRDMPTRPLDYADATEARLCGPSFKAHDPSEEVLAEKARERVAARLEKQFAEQADEKPAKRKPAEAAPAKDVAPANRGNRRAMRRQMLDTEKSGQEVTA